MKKLTYRIITLFLLLDFLFGALVTFAFLQLLGVSPRSDGALVMVGFLLCKAIICAICASMLLAPFERYENARKERERDSLLTAADQALQAFPVRYSSIYVGTWIFMLAGSFWVMVGSGRGHFTLNQGSGLSVALILGAVVFGAFALVFPLVALLTAEPSGRCSIDAREKGIDLFRSKVRLQIRIGVVAVCLALGPLLWMIAVGYMSQVQAALTVGMDPRMETVSAVATGRGFLVSSGAFAVIVLLWAPICSVALSLSVSRPLDKLSEATREIVEEGNQTSMGTVAVMCNDEVGILSDRYNDLLDMMRDLSLGADAIAGGDLTIRLERQGELPEAFAKMAAGLRDMVEQIRKTSLELGSAATEILAATQEQEAAATSQSTAMTEISHTMDSLSESAAHVSESVAGVLDNAEQTVSTADDMVGHIQNLSGHTGRITELLDVIRGIADKSDLLALNGSLEASRAGEGGQGFALVAAEMRRLAERVTATVEDVKKMLSDIRASSSSTIMATEESRRLARETTEAARQITIVSQQQRTGTEQVSESVREVANVVTQAAAATSQTRTSAQGLKDHADLLSGLVSQFRVRGERS